MNNKVIGNAGENIACQFLQKQGYKIVERNKHFSKFCEIDIIAQHKNKYIFVEVKTRQTTNFGSPFEAITKTKHENIKKGVLNYLSEHNYKSYRIDVIGITLKPELKIEHLQNI